MPKYILALIPLFFCSLVHAQESEPQMPLCFSKEQLKRRISEFAEKMEVLPLDVIAPEPEVREGQCRNEQYDITLERYRVFYEFKKYVYELSINEIHICTSMIKEMPPKERGLILVMAYLYELGKRPEFRPCSVTIFRNFFGQRAENNITIPEWNGLSFILRYYSDVDSPDSLPANDHEIAFPAIEIQGDPSELAEKYRETRSEVNKRCLKLQEEFNVFGYYGYYGITIHTVDRDCRIGKIPSYFREKYAHELDEITILYEFSHCLDARVGLINNFWGGNSSEKPKTVQGIALQLWESREHLLKTCKEERERFGGMYETIDE